MKILVWNVRNEKGVSLRELSKLTGIGKSTLQRLENGEVYPRMDAMEKIAIALDVKISDLYESDYK